jgi:hypothetical protein
MAMQPAAQIDRIRQQLAGLAQEFVHRHDP